MVDLDDQILVFLFYYVDKELDLMFKSELDDYNVCDSCFYVYYFVFEGVENW